MTSLPKRGNINRGGFAPPSRQRGRGLVCSPRRWQSTAPPSPARPSARSHRQADCSAPLRCPQPLHRQQSALSSPAFLLLKVVLLVGLGDLGRFFFSFSFMFSFSFFFFVFVYCCYLILFLILDAATGFCSTSLHEQAAPLRDFTAFKGHRTATMVKCLV